MEHFGIKWSSSVSNDHISSGVTSGEITNMTWTKLGPYKQEPGVAKYVPVMKYPEHSPGVLTVEPSQAWDPVTVGGVGMVAPERLEEFYEELHSYLAAAGVDGIKVGCGI